MKLGEERGGPDPHIRRSEMKAKKKKKKPKKSPPTTTEFRAPSTSQIGRKDEIVSALTSAQKPESTTPNSSEQCKSKRVSQLSQSKFDVLLED